VPGPDSEGRLAKNEALFREVNERIKRLSEQLDVREAVEFTCECADAACTESIPVAIDEYERVRRQPRLFLVAPTHVFPEVEDVIEEHGGFWVVCKHAAAAAPA
jgi:hypothetical protein